MMRPHSPDIRIITALPAEAKPINHHFSLQRDNRITAFPLFRNEELMLVVSGVGQQAAAAATQWLHGHSPPRHNSLWINIGIAGHATRELGQAILADRVCNDQGADISIATPAVPAFARATVVTVAQPTADYPDDRIYDMEAFGFISVASRLLPPGAGQCLKIISDNRDNPMRSISAKLVSGLISDQIDTLVELIEHWDI
jgi:nucleoside phosphorylase